MQSINIEPKEKLECLKFISQIHRSQFTERSKHEWKIVFSSLSFYVLFVVAVYSGQITPTIQESEILTSIVPGMFLALATVIAIYLGYVHMSNNKNKTFAENAENAISDLLKRDLLKSKMLQTLDIFCLKGSEHWISWDSFCEVNREGKGKRGRWGWIGQVVTIFIFAFATILLIYLKHNG